MNEAKVVPGAEPAVIPDVCYCSTCVLARLEQNAFFAEPEPELPTQDYPHANVLLDTNWGAVLISFAACLSLILIALGGLYVVYRLKLAGWMN